MLSLFADRGSGVADPLFAEITLRKSQTDASASLFAANCRRADALYYPTDITEGGADHWAGHESARTKGMVHISLNDPQVSVDIPANIQSLPPEIDYMPESMKPEHQEAADRREELFWRWWAENDMDTEFPQASQTRSLYGAVIVQPWWDGEMPTFTVHEQPANIRIGWGNTRYNRKDWALHIFELSPQAVKEDYDLDVTKKDGKVFVGPSNETFTIDDSGVRSAYEATQVTVYDYWYKKDGDIWNALYVGNYQVHDQKHPEFLDIPFIYIPNGKLPGRPYGRGELYDIEQLIREEDEATSRLGQIFSSSDGPMWQVNGPNAPSIGEGIPDSAVPKPNSIVSAGPDNVLNPISPFLPEFQTKDYLQWLEHKRSEITGISDTLLGLQGAGAGSSKELRARVALYEPRIRTKRQMLYRGMILELWTMSAMIWEHFDPKVKKIIDGHYLLEVTPPEIVPPDDLEAMQWAVNGVQNRIVSLSRAQKRVKVKNPTQETVAIMHEQTNASLNPGAVTQQIQLIGMARQLNIAPDQPAQQQGETVRDQAINDLATKRAAAAQRAQNPPPGGSQSNNTELTAAPGSMPDNALAPNGATATSQTMLQNGKETGRILASQNIPMGG